MRKMIKSHGDLLISALLILISMIIILVMKLDPIAMFKTNSSVIFKTLYLTFFAIAISTLIHFVIPQDFAERYLKKRKIYHYFLASILGILTPGPVFAIYPIIMVMKKKGVPNSILISYLTGQTVVGPARAPFEIGFFGIKFFALRIALVLVLGPLSGILYEMLNKVWSD